MASLDWTQQSCTLLNDMRSLDKKFRQSCKQILLINNQIEDLQVRYNRAAKLNRRSFRYSLRLRLATLEGVRNMFYEYASRCASNLEDIQDRLFYIGNREGVDESGEELEPVVSSDDEAMDADESSLSERDYSDGASTSAGAAAADNTLALQQRTIAMQQSINLHRRIALQQARRARSGTRSESQPGPSQAVKADPLPTSDRDEDSDEACSEDETDNTGVDKTQSGTSDQLVKTDSEAQGNSSPNRQFCEPDSDAGNSPEVTEELVNAVDSGIEEQIVEDVSEELSETPIRDVPIQRTVNTKFAADMHENNVNVRDEENGANGSNPDSNTPEMVCS